MSEPTSDRPESDTESAAAVEPVSLVRRHAVLGLLAAGVLTTVVLPRWRTPDLVYQDIPELSPFRELVSDGGVSRASPLFIGLRDPSAENDGQLEARIAQVRANPCGSLFGELEDQEVLAIAYFSDFYCPYCRVLEQNLSNVFADDAGLRLVQHELPLLGGASVSAAKAVLAADLQGGYSEMKARLLRTGLITNEAYLRAVTPELGLDADRLLRDMESPEIADRLLTSRALGRVFGIAGTPALVIGRTLVMGAVTARTIKRVIEDERALALRTC